MGLWVDEADGSGTVAGRNEDRIGVGTLEEDGLGGGRGEGEGGTIRRG